jgi:hypothetical protein
MTRAIAHALALLLLAVAVGYATWEAYADSGLAMATSMGVIHAILFSSGLPFEEWILIPRLASRLGSTSSERFYLSDPCRVPKCRSQQRHVHFCEVLDITDGNLMARTFGAITLGRTATRDIRYQFLYGVLAAAAVVLISLPRAGGDTAASVTSGLSAAEFNFGEAGFALAVGLIPLLTAGYFVAWFRKQNELLV